MIFGIEIFYKSLNTGKVPGGISTLTVVVGCGSSWLIFDVSGLTTQYGALCPPVTILTLTFLFSFNIKSLSIYL